MECFPLSNFNRVMEMVIQKLPDTQHADKECGDGAIFESRDDSTDTVPAIQYLITGVQPVHIFLTGKFPSGSEFIFQSIISKFD